MYAVSEAYKVQMKKSVQQRKLRGTINEVVPFTDDDILDGSFTLTNQIMDQNAFGYGGVYIAELHLTFVTERVYDRRNWKGKRLFIEDGLYIDAEGDYEYIPLGHFRVAEANYTTWGLEIKAYDLMSKFDKVYSGVNPSGTPYELACIACEACDIPMHLSEIEFNAVTILPDTPLYLYLLAGVKTWRDYLSYLCQACNMYCYMYRDGSLDFKKIAPASQSLVDTPTDTIPMANRFGDGMFSDFATYYSGLKATFVKDREDNLEEIFGSEEGIVIDIGANPFLQTVGNEGTDEAIQDVRDEITRTEDLITDLGAEIDRLELQKDDLEDQIEDVEEQIEQHPSDKELKKLLKQLQGQLVEINNTIEATQSEKRRSEQRKSQLEELLADMEEEAQSFTVSTIGIRLEFMSSDLMTIQYTPGKMSMLGDPAYDLGDTIRFEEGIAGGVSDLCIMRYDYTFGDRYTIENFGDSPGTEGAASKETKTMEAKQRSVKKDQVNFITFTSAEDYEVEAVRQEILIVDMDFGVAEQTDVEEWTEIKMVISGDTKIRLNYWLDGVKIEDYTVEETYSGTLSGVFDGECLVLSKVASSDIKTVNYHYHLSDISPRNSHTWEVTMDVLEGSVSIDAGDIHSVLWAQGMIPEGEWIGLIEAEDSVPVYPITPLRLFGEMNDAVTVSIQGADTEITTESGDTLITESGEEITITSIEDLPDADPLDGTEYIPIVQSGSTVKITTQDLADL